MQTLVVQARKRAIKVITRSKNSEEARTGGRETSSNVDSGNAVMSASMGHEIGAEARHRKLTKKGTHLVCVAHLPEDLNDLNGSFQSSNVQNQPR